MHRSSFAGLTNEREGAAPPSLRGTGASKQKKRTYPTPAPRPDTQAMSPEPASLVSQSSLDPRRVIGFFLARLFAYLVRLQSARQKVVPKDIAYMVASAEAMVNSFIRTLAMKQLKKTGYTSAARALRDPDGLRRAAATQAESAPATTAELVDRLQTTIETFDRADAVASLIARMIVCALALVLSRRDEPRSDAHTGAQSAIQNCRMGLGPPTITPVGQGPPYQQTKLRFAVGRRCTANGFAEIPPE